MSWDAHLYDDRGHTEGDWNYTHNTNGMVRTALDTAGIELPDDTRPCSWYDRETETWHNAPEGHGKIGWYDHLDGMSGTEGKAFLSTILDHLEADPERFRATNPPNGWGDYDGLVKVLTGMRDAVPEWPCEWVASG